MKKIYLLILIACLIPATAISQGCLPEGITFTTQAQIDNFQTDYPGCTKILGSVRLEGDPVNYITNLNGLNVLTSIGGSLWIGSGMWPGGCIGLPDLGSLSGLNSVTSIGGNFQLCGSPLISDLSGLENLTSIDGFLNIYDNGNLSSLYGLENLDSIGQSFYIGEVTDYGDPHGNRKLKSLSNLENLLYVGGDLYIGGNDSLSSLLGLEKVAPQSINNLQIESNPMLSNCDVQSICNYLLNPNGEVEIHDNATGCNSLDEVEVACESVSINETNFTDNLSIHPNPFTTSTTIEYELTKPSSVQLTIYDYLGKQVDVIEKKQAQGKQQIIWNAEGLQAGVYFCVIKANRRIKTTKLIKL